MAPQAAFPPLPTATFGGGGGLTAGMPFPTTFPSGVPPPPPPLTPAQLAALPHDNDGPLILIILWALNAGAGAFLCLRLYCKFTRHRGLGWDDHFLILSWLLIVGAASIQIYTVGLGYGKHVWDIPFENLAKLGLPFSISGTISILAAVWSKTSFAITMLRLLRNTDAWTKAIVWCIIISMNVAMGLSALFVWIQCTPIERSWNPLIPGTCFSPDTIVNYNIFSAAYSAAMDIVLALLPWKLIWALQMKRAEKLGVCIAMSMGLFAAATAFVKITHLGATKSLDLADGIPLVLWGHAESAVTIMAASVPILRALLKSPRGRSPAPAYQSESKFFSDNFELQSRSTVTIQTLHRRSREPRASRTASWVNWMPGGGGGGGILGTANRSNHNSMELHVPADGKIVETREVTVEYDDKTEEEQVRQTRLNTASSDREGPQRRASMVSLSDMPDLKLAGADDENWPIRS